LQLAEEGASIGRILVKMLQLKFNRVWGLGAGPVENVEGDILFLWGGGLPHRARIAQVAEGVAEIEPDIFASQAEGDCEVKLVGGEFSSPHLSLQRVVFWLSR